jgi:hypothetical protein
MLDNIPDYIPYSLLALFSIGIGIYLFKDTVRFALKGQRTSGRIVNWMSASENGKKYFYPVIEFTPNGGETLRVRTEDRCESEPMFAVGTAVTVKYDTSNFKTIRVEYPKKTS